MLFLFMKLTRYFLLKVLIIMPFLLYQLKIKSVYLIISIHFALH